MHQILHTFGQVHQFQRAACLRHRNEARNQFADTRTVDIRNISKVQVVRSRTASRNTVDPSPSVIRPEISITVTSPTWRVFNIRLMKFRFGSPILPDPVFRVNAHSDLRRVVGGPLSVPSRWPSYPLLQARKLLAGIRHRASSTREFAKRPCPDREEPQVAESRRHRLKLAELAGVITNFTSSC
jgi:hypothetical protein